MAKKPITTEIAYQTIFEWGLDLPLPPDATYVDYRVEAIAIRMAELSNEQWKLCEELKRLKEEGDGA